MFYARGGGGGSPRRQAWGVVFFCENPRRRGDFQEGEGLRGREGGIGEFFWGGLIIFFRGRNVLQVLLIVVVAVAVGSSIAS